MLRRTRPLLHEHARLPSRRRRAHHHGTDRGSRSEKMIGEGWRHRFEQLRDLFVVLVIDRPYRPGRLIANRYRVEEVLGMGSYGISYLCADTQTGQRCVLKQVRPSKRRGNKGAPIYEYETSLLAAL